MCGATDVGKSSVCKTLLNYALNDPLDAKPVFVDFDVGQVRRWPASSPGRVCGRSRAARRGRAQSNIGVPGTIGAALIGWLLRGSLLAAMSLSVWCDAPARVG